MDMYSPYIYLIKKVFPHATIVFDRFHISRALNKTRIKTMNTDKGNYNKFKRYCRLLLKRQSSLDNVHYKHFTCFNRPMTQLMVVRYLVESNKELLNTYNFYQDFLYYIDEKNLINLKELINSDTSNLSEYMQTANSTFMKYEEYILNAFTYPYSNGSLEGINNKIKVIKRVAFGYRSFYNFKQRIMISCNLINIKKA